MQFRLDKDTITPELSRIMREVKRPRSLYAAGAKAVQKGIVAHLQDLQSRGNAKGWPEKKFFSGGPDSVRKRVGISALSDAGAVVTIADPRFVHRIEGGTVTPKRAKSLAIPLTAEAYAASGKGTLREAMPGLVLIKTSKGAFLAMPTDNRGKGRDQLRIMFKLVPSVTHRPHPDEMPDTEKLSEAARGAMQKAGEILLRAGK
jgi:hypothetical protein